MQHCDFQVTSQKAFQHPNNARIHHQSSAISQAIKNSGCETDDIESADLVYVYDYCYYTWWLAHAHSMGRDKRDTPGDHLIKVINHESHLARNYPDRE